MNALRPTELKWTREGKAWVADAPEGHYQIQGRSGSYNVWYFGDDRYVKQPDTVIATGIGYLDYAKVVAKEDHAKRTAIEAYTVAVVAKIEAAEKQVRHAIDAARRDGMEEAETILMAAYGQLGVTRGTMLRAGMVSAHDPREVSA